MLHIFNRAQFPFSQKYTPPANLEHLKLRKDVSSTKRIELSDDDEKLIAPPEPLKYSVLLKNEEKTQIFPLVKVFVFFYQRDRY